ncbi:inhibin alpha chain [Trichomycterus rosablanca]|uniref:inhibin alpha chain n=1 Tax=Trichomycterus rosablanca TaxID=2290929 RepID=UPI002F355E0E
MGIWQRYFILITCAIVFMAAWVGLRCQACRGDLPREVVLNWIKRQILEGLELDEPPSLTVQSPLGEKVHRAAQHRTRRVLREAKAERRHHQETSQVIMFPSSDSTCLDISVSSETSPSYFTYYFQPSLVSQDSVITSLDFWFYAGEAIIANVSHVPLYILTSQQELLQVAQKPSKRSPDGWTTYRFGQHLLRAVADGPFVLQVRCLVCSCYNSAEDKTPFLHVHARPRGPERTRRSTQITWSPDAIETLQRPSSERISSDCMREQIQISFEELGWDNWIVHPKSFIFYYCHGNCLSPERTATRLGMRQCCAPVPESMKSLRFTTTSDGGFSFKYETLPNIIPDECNCI